MQPMKTHANCADIRRKATTNGMIRQRKENTVVKWEANSNTNGYDTIALNTQDTNNKCVLKHKRDKFREALNSYVVATTE